MRATFISTIIVICLIVGGFYYIFYTPSLILKEIPGLAEKYLKEGELKSIKIGGQSFEYPETLKLYNIRAQIEWRNELYDIGIGELDILTFQTFMKEKKQLVFTAINLDLQKDDFNMKKGIVDVTLNFDGENLVGYGGLMRGGELNLNSYQFSGTQAKFEGNRGGFRIPEFTAVAYGGKLRGQIKVENNKRSTEELSVEFTGLQSQSLQNLNKTVFSQLTGDFNGSVKMTKVDQQLQVLAILAEMKKGGEMGRELTKRIASYMTDEESRYTIENLADQNSKLVFDNAEFRILNASQNLASVTVTLSSKKDNFRVQETINIDISRILQKIAWKN